VGVRHRESGVRVNFVSENISFSVTPTDHFHRSPKCFVCGVPVPTAWSVGLRMEERPPAMEVSCEYISSHRQTTRGGPPAWGFGVGLTTLYRKY
jgi:hypothetical protein